MVLGFALLPLVPATGTRGDPSSLRSLSLAGRVEVLTAMFAGLGAYFMWFWTGGRFTLPMGTWHMRLRTRGGDVVRWPAALLRYAACWIGPVIALTLSNAVQAHGGHRWPLGFLVLNFAWALWDRDRQFLHDRVAGTRLVLVAPARASG